MIQRSTRAVALQEITARNRRTHATTHFGPNEEVLHGRRARRRGIDIEISATSSSSKNIGKQFIESFFDVADFVSGSTQYQQSELAQEIGKQCYVDLNGWHLFLKDMKPQGEVNTGLAKVVEASVLRNGKRAEYERIIEILKTVKVPLGYGKCEQSLFDLMPKRSVDDFLDICKKFADDL